METTDRTKLRQKSFTFRTSVSWKSERSGALTANGKPPIQVSAPREFRGNPNEWSAEDLFIAAVEICHMQTFLAYAAEHSVKVVSYTSHANGVLEFIDGDYRFTRIVIFPTIGIPAAGTETAVHGLLREAEKHCLVANSIASIVEVNPTIIVEQG
jgi:organic hydroperoxide reductase OsmC/OhrA